MVYFLPASFARNVLRSRSRLNQSYSKNPQTDFTMNCLNLIQTPASSVLPQDRTLPHPFNPILFRPTSSNMAQHSLWFHHVSTVVCRNSSFDANKTTIQTVDSEFVSFVYGRHKDRIAKYFGCQKS